MPVKESKKVTNVNSREMETSCTFCAQKLDLPTYFSHAKEVHGVFSCLYCLRYFKFSQELMVHLTREHKVVPQKFASGAEFLERGGTDTTLLCVECNQVFPSDALVTYMKSHVRECRKSTGICPKCGSIQPLTSLGEHILQCQGSKNVNLIGSTTITTSQLRNRDNSCKYCGKKFSPSKIAAHMRACSVRSTKTTINVWNSNRSDILSTGSSDDVEEKPVTGLLKSGINSVPKNSEARRDTTGDKFDSSSLLSSPDSTLSPKVGKSKKFIRSDSLPSVKFSVSKNSLSPQPPKLKRSDSLLPPALLRTSPKKDSSVTSIKSTKPVLARKSPSVSPPKLPVSNRRNKVQIQFESSSPLHQSQLTPSPTPLPTTEAEAQPEELPPSLSPFSEDLPEEVQQPCEVPPPKEPVLDPLLREEDQDKRLGILIKELAEKLVEMQQQQTLPPAEVTPQPEPESENGAPKPLLPQTPKYEILVNYSLERKSVDSILSDMLVKTSDDCPYCRLVRLIRIDKRQLAIHMLSKHAWDLRVRPASPEERKAENEEGKLSSPVKLEPSVQDVSSELKSQGSLPGQSNVFTVQDQPEGNPEIKMEPSDEAPKEGTSVQDSAPATKISESNNEPESQNTQSSDQPLLPQPSIFDPVSEPTKPSLFDPPESVAKTTPVHSLFDPPSPPPPEPNLAKPSIFEPAESLEGAPNGQVSGDSLPCSSSIQASSPLALPDETAASSSSNVEGSESLPATDGPCPPEAGKTELNDAKADPMEDMKNDELKNPTPHSDEDDLSKETRNVKEENNELSGKGWEEDNNAVVPLDLTWSDFRICLLAKVFHSSNIVYTFAGDQLSNFGEKPCECLLCGFLADSQKSLFPHWRKTHRGIAMKCTMCKGRFLFAGALYSHLCLGTPEPLTLKENEMEDDDDGNSETVGLRYQCGSCDNIQLPGFFNYMVHLRKDHNRCELCLEQAQTQKELEYHIKKHKLNHFCWKCNLSYCAKPNLMTHLFWKHGTESVDCSKCLKKKWPHIYHFCLPPEYFVCEVCGLYFTRPTALRVHTRLHTGEKLRKCPKHSCQERFISKKLLQKHLESVHAKVEPAPVIPVVVDPVKIEESTGGIDDSSTADSQSEPLKVNGEVMDSNGSEQCPVADDTHPPEESKQSIPPADMPNSEEIPDQQHPTPDDSSKIEDHVEGENGVKVPPSITSTDEVSEGLEGVTTEGSKPEGNEEGVVETAAAIEQDKRAKKSGGKSNGERSPRSKPFNLAKIQGPNLSESESESEDDAAGNQSTPSLEPTEELKKDDENDLIVQPAAAAALSNGMLESGSPSQSTPSSPLKQEEAVKMDVDEAPVASELSSSDRGDVEMHSLVQDPVNVPKTNVDDNTALDDSTTSFSKSQADVVGSDSVLDGGVEKSKSGDEFGSMSPLLLPLEDFDFSVPEIPTFEENHLPEHIIQENALFSIQHEHDYCSPNFSASGFKRKSSSPGAYGQGGVFQGRNDVSEISSPRGRPKKLKAGKSSPKKSASRKRCRSSSSSSSSSSSCSSCGSNCSCSSSSSGSSSSSSSSSSGSDSESSENEKSPVKKSPKRISKLKIKSLSPKKKSETKKVVNNGKMKAEKAVRVPRKKRAKALKAGNNKKTAERNENIEPPKEPEPEPEPFILESDLDTDDSGTEEVFHKKQLTEMIGASKPSTDAVWTMSSEKFLLKVVRGVDDLEQLRPPPPPPPPPPPKVSKNNRGVKYSVKSNGTSEQRLKVRNVPIKPLIVKRDMQSLDGNHMVGGGVFRLDTSSTDGYNSPDFPSANAKLGKIHSESTPPPMKKMTARVRANQMKAKSTHEGSMSPYVVEDPFAMPLPPDGQSPSATKRRASRGGGGGGGRKSGGAKAEKLSKKAAAAAEAYVDERLYCICQSPHDNVSQMIGCDSKDCQYKWFHFECVDIVIPPKGKWFCSECREVRRQKAAARSAAKREELQQQHQQQLQN